MKYKIGDRITFSTFNGEIIGILYDVAYRIKWNDMENETSHNSDHIDELTKFDKQYYRDKQLKQIGI